MFSAMLMGAFRDTDVGIGINYRADGSAFSLRRLQANTKVTSDTFNDFLFADDCALNAASEADVQNSIEKYVKACNNFGLTISLRQTEVMHQSALGKTLVEPCVSFNVPLLNAMDKFTCLGRTLSGHVVKARLAKGGAADSTGRCGTEGASPYRCIGP